MNYTKFKDCVIRGLKEQVGEGKEVNVDKVIKTNDTELDGVTIFDGVHNVMPTFYLNDAYVKYRRGASIEEIVDEILCLIDYYSNTNRIDIDIFDSFDNVKDMIACKLVNIERNEQLLKEVPFRKFLDLAIVVYAVITHEDQTISTCLINNSVIKDWDVSVDELIDWAIFNTSEVMGEMCLPLFSAVKGHQDEFEFYEGSITDPEDAPIFVLTNKRKVNGAAGILDEDLMQHLGMAFEDDLYIIPSSIHEVILIPSRQAVSKSRLDEIVFQVNQCAIDPKDFLSDHTYFYSRKLNQIMM